MNIRKRVDRFNLLEDLFGSQKELYLKLGYNDNSYLSSLKNKETKFQPSTKSKFSKIGINPEWLEKGYGVPYTDSQDGLELRRKIIDYLGQDFQPNLDLYNKKEKIRNTLLPIEFGELTKITSGAAAGDGTPFMDGFETDDIPKKLIKDVQNEFIIDAAGDSMTPLINPGDRLHCIKNPAPKSGDLVVCMLNGDILVKIYLELLGEASLRSINKQYQEIDLTENDEIVFFGKVKTIMKDLPNNLLKY